MKEIAKVCNVSQAVVSKALADRPGVSEATRKRILEVARQFNYRPNALVRSLQQGQTMTIAVAASVMEDVYAARILQAIFERLYHAGYEALVFSWDQQVRDGSHMLRSMGERRVDGLLMFPPAETPSAEYMAELRSFRRPIVLLDQAWRGAEFDFVGFDDIGGARQATEHLLSLGHRDIANLHHRAVSTGQDRFDGYLAAMMAGNATVRQEWVLDGGIDYDASYRQALHLLSLPNRPTAVVCFNDIAALGVLSAAADRGLSVPRDLSIVGFADLPQATQVRPALTTVRQDAGQLGERAVNQLLERLEQSRSNTTERTPAVQERLPTELVVRASSGPAPQR
jgi:DNA-binding LacI/PurR family transcriptional regulator